MASNNQILIIGRVGNEPKADIKTLPSGSHVLDLRLAVNRPNKNAAGQTVTDWLQCKFWDKQAETVAQYVGKGDLLSVSGSLRSEGVSSTG